MEARPSVPYTVIRAVILAVPFTSAVATLIEVLVLGHEPHTEQRRRTLQVRGSG